MQLYCHGTHYYIIFEITFSYLANNEVCLQYKKGETLYSQSNKKSHICLVTFSCVCLSPGALVDRFNLPSRPGNPVYGPRMQLYCRTGFHIGIFPTGRVKGIEQDHHDFGKLVYLVMLKIA
jgi:hypothetical protein